ncbi:MAG: DUF3369 domain-containing protein [Spirochaetaceae bacterium]|nr:DUF3369 domain-containing protein [Spirochaetaceae bacterium]
MSDLVFAEKRQDTYPHGSWKVLIVDDDPGIHAITRTVLRDLVYENRTLEFLSAFGRRDAETLIAQNDDIVLVLLDVVMEEDDSGLRLVRYLRDELGNTLVRIILRTGQPGKAPSQKVIVDYDINDYEEKTDLTAQKLYTTIIASLRNYCDLQSLDAIRMNLTRHKSGLALISTASVSLFSAKSPREFAIEAYHHLMNLISHDDNKDLSSFVALQNNEDFRILEGTGRFADIVDSDPIAAIGEGTIETLRSMKRDGHSLLIQDESVDLYEDARKFRLLIHIDKIYRLEIYNHQLLNMFASNLSMAFENLRLSREIIGTQEELIVKVGEVVETRSHDTAQHVLRVGEFCALLASKIGMDEYATRELKMASALHDIGKIGIPDDILLKPDILTEEEFEVIKTHPKVGYSILKHSTRSMLKTASVICLQHHERWDGKGYPAGIRGEKIDLNAQIVAICDVFDSLTHGRLHRDPWDIEQAADYLRKEKNGAFNAQLVDLMLEDLSQLTEINDRYPD